MLWLINMEEPNSQPRLTDIGLGFPHTNGGPFGSPRDSLESRSLSYSTGKLGRFLVEPGHLEQQAETVRIC